MTPAFPYQPGNKFEIHAHTPPQPYGANYKNKDPVRTPVRGLAHGAGNKVDHMGFVISNPPLDRVDTNTKAQPPQVLTIIQVISHKPKGEGGGPVVVRGYLNADESTHHVAKIYDGFEYALAEPGKDGCDCMYRADMHYSREAAAYESIPARFQGSIVPRYFGSWTFPLPTGVPGRHRWVRMVLIEHVDGECMLDMILRARGATRSNPEPERYREESPVLDYSLLPPEGERLDILARIVEAETYIWWYGGVRHCDVAPRKVIISRSGPSNAVSRVTLIDFNAAYVHQRCEAGRQRMAETGHGKGLPISPIERYWIGSQFAYGGRYSEWIPESWAVQEDSGGVSLSHLFAAKWLVSRWKGSPKFQPPSESFFDRPFHRMAERYLQLIRGLKAFVAQGRQATGQEEGSVTHDKGQS
ncbi:hypothetical protein C8A01DRAFT_38273 [Parachaetomium inaequale]|uniref:Uncharacterized protein n=1 Tax=Parachaetomium inaequale TaxID=2588326 RepID=A0AAN6PBB6_9PEZI|nr:hypothetical protein C8A01DRAFT_38273 [Parachaetomium inaequale]